MKYIDIDIYSDYCVLCLGGQQTTGDINLLISITPSLLDQFQHFTYVNLYSNSIMQQVRAHFLFTLKCIRIAAFSRFFTPIRIASSVASAKFCGHKFRNFYS